MSNTVSPAYLRLVELLIGSRVALALRIAAEKHVADLLVRVDQPFFERNAVRVGLNELFPDG